MHSSSLFFIASELDEELLVASPRLWDTMSKTLVWCVCSQCCLADGGQLLQNKRTQRRHAEVERSEAHFAQVTAPESKVAAENQLYAPVSFSQSRLSTPESNELRKTMGAQIVDVSVRTRCLLELPKTHNSWLWTWINRCINVIYNPIHVRLVLRISRVRSPVAVAKLQLSRFVDGNGLRNIEDPARGKARLAVVVDALESGLLFFATGANRGFPVLEGLKGATLEREGAFTRGLALLVMPADGRRGRPGIEAIAIG
ncbi:hypothetical protein DEU56DRAFT_919703 [Suillus clintonianus]|uniref:uncharacterized protein n=1 Tax=Suillus clintonianus TaxID=1904413 RepID=UPI001B873981|nr:uncharacterized protein DEU56DRAFT_919703 [Suillus clintonianus]KAG2113374.1 hypothetical protein DEU56DRAFT_919703 [Suillus clintonianus]